MSKQKVVIIGLGYIGLPTAAIIASNNIYVYGVDINKKIVDTINRGEIHIVEPGLSSSVAKVVKGGFLKADKQAVIAETYLVAVPTPLKKNMIPDISLVEAATTSIIPLLKEDDLFIIESTCPVGTTEKMMNLIYSERPELKEKLYISYCPERVLPGNAMNELVYNDRVIGGVNENSTQKAMNFYKKFVKGKLYPVNSRTAEMCKLVENSSRDVQIAFANELSLICNKANINVWELIKLANKHPRVNILQPSCGVGGHCIAVDPYFIINDYVEESKIISTARNVNNYKSVWCIEKIKNAKLKFELQFNKKPKIAIMGLTFKPNVDDLRESPANYITQEVIEDTADNHYYICEPNIKEHTLFKLTNYKLAIEKSDILVLLVAHKEFENLNIEENKIVLDFCGISKNKI